MHRRIRCVASKFGIGLFLDACSTTLDDANPHEENPIPRLGAYAMGKRLSLDLATSERHGGKALSFFTGVCGRQS